MNRLTIVMNSDRSLVQDAYSLGVERDNKIDELALMTPKSWNGLDMLDSDVSLHLKAEDNYFYNTVCDNKQIDGCFAVFLFPVTREMTNRNGTVKLEFAFENSAFSFTSRSIELTVNKSLTDSEDVESDYPGVLADVLNTVDGFAKRLDDTDSLVATIDDDVDVLFNKAERFESSISKVEALLGYDDEEILGLEADFENKVFTRLAGAKGLNAGEDFDRFPTYQRRRCNVSDDGTILAYYGDENYRDDGTNGQVMVYQPAFYYRVVPIKLEKIEGGLGYHIRKANYYISAKPKPLFKLHPAFFDKNGNEVEYILYSAYEGSMWDASAEGCVDDGTDSTTDTDLATDKLCSVAGVKPISGKSKKITRVNAQALANNRGDGWYLESVKAVSANQLLMTIEFANFNMQSSVGRGVIAITASGAYNCSSLTGSTKELGNATGSATQTTGEVNGTLTSYSTDGKVSVSYRGIENPWGNIWKHIDGINIWGDGTLAGGQLYVADDFNYAESKKSENYKPVGFTLPATSGTVNAIGYGSKSFDWLMIPSELGGNSELPIGDSIAITANLNGYKTACFGGTFNSNYGAGGFSFLFNYSVGVSTYICGGRLIYVPTAK